MSEKVKNVFISHVHEDDKLLPELKDLLGKNGYEIRDSSIDSSKPNEATSEEYIKSGILAPRIQWAGTVVVLVTPETKDRPWVDWEIEYAHKQDKRIVGVWGQGCQDSDVPKALEKYADAVVGWQADRVIDAIEGKIDNWFTCGGEERGPRSIARHNCSR